MQLVILAAGRGERMKQLTADRPKALLEVGGKSLLEYKLDRLPDEIDEIVAVIGYRGGMIREKFGHRYNGRPIVYVEQREKAARGTAGALWAAAPAVRNNFMVAMGDDIYASSDLERLSRKKWAILLLPVSELALYAKVSLDGLGNVAGVVEAGHHQGGFGFANTSLYSLDRRIFKYPLVPKVIGDREFGLPQTIV